MREHKFFKKKSSVRKIFYDKFVGVLSKKRSEFARALDKLSSFVHLLNKRKFVTLADVGVVLTECGGDMNYTRAVGKSDVTVACDIESLSLFDFGKVEKRNVFAEFVFLALFRFNLFVAFEKRID